MSKRKYRCYTLWIKFRRGTWEPYFTVCNGPSSWPSPLRVIEQWVEKHFLYPGNRWWVRGKTWMIKPEGQKPAELEK